MKTPVTFVAGFAPAKKPFTRVRALVKGTFLIGSLDWVLESDIQSTMVRGGNSANR